MKDSQLIRDREVVAIKYIKANNERFSTSELGGELPGISISRRIMKDSQQNRDMLTVRYKYIKANNERFSTSIFTV